MLDLAYSLPTRRRSMTYDRQAPLLPREAMR
jgi:hypothetical protein